MRPLAPPIKTGGFSAADLLRGPQLRHRDARLRRPEKYGWRVVDTSGRPRQALPPGALQRADNGEQLLYANAPESGPTGLSGKSAVYTRPMTPGRTYAVITTRSPSGVVGHAFAVGLTAAPDTGVLSHYQYNNGLSDTDNVGGYGGAGGNIVRNSYRFTLWYLDLINGSVTAWYCPDYGSASNLSTSVYSYTGPVMLGTTWFVGINFSAGTICGFLQGGMARADKLDFLNTSVRIPTVIRPDTIWL